MNQVDTLPDVRYRSEVLYCSILTHLCDLKVICFFFSTFLLWKQLKQIVGQTSVSLVTLACGSWNEGQHDPYCTIPVILPYILKTIWCMNIILWDCMSVWPDMWAQNKCRSLWLIFHGPVILPFILKTIWYMNTILWDYEFDLKIFVGHCDLYFMVQWFVLISWKVFSGWTSYFGIMNQYDPTSDLKIFVGPCDLYFMVHWICLISWRLFDL